MGKNVDHLQHIKSNVVLENGKPKLPQASDLVEGELAINYAYGVETISIKNSSGDIKTFSSDEYYSKQKLGSAFTDANSAVTVTEALDDKLDASAYTECWVSGTGQHSAVLKGSGSIASGQYSVAEGQNTSATSTSSHAEGQSTQANGVLSHAEGNGTQANGYFAHSEGVGARADGNSSHAEGYGTQANGDYSHAEGYNTQAIGYYSHAEGSYTNATNVSEHASGKYNVSNKANDTWGNSGNTLFSVGNGTAENARHNAFEIRQNGDIYIVNKEGNDVRLQDELGNITVDQVLDDTTSASTNPVSSKAVYDAVTDNELVWTNAFVVLSGAVSSHTSNDDIHLTSTEKTNIDSLATNIAAISGITSTKVNNWDNAAGNSHTHANMNILSAITASSAAINSLSGTVGSMAFQDASNYYTTAQTSGSTALTAAFNSKANTSDLNNLFDNAKYEDSGTSKVINFYHGNNIISTINADDFIKDGMVESATVETSGSTTVLVITWNSDASGKTTILDIGDIFEADNYYTTAQTSGSTALTAAFNSKANTATTLAGYSITDAYTKTDIDNKLGSGFTVSSVTEVMESNERIMAGAWNDLNTNKLDASAYTVYNGTFSVSGNGTSVAFTSANASGNTGVNIKSGSNITITTGANEITIAASQPTVNNGTLTLQANGTPKKTFYANQSSATTFNITSGSTSGTISIDGTDVAVKGLDSMAYESTSGYSSATQVNTALGKKVDNTEYATFSAETVSAITDLSGQSETIAAALVDLSNSKLDATAYTPTDLSNYYTKSETSGKTEISTALSSKANTATTLAGYGITNAYTKTEVDTALSGKISVEDYENDSHAIAIALDDLYKKIQDVELLLQQI